jgi:hypothetical protein
MTCWAKITAQFEGFHNYPNAPDDVAFLRDIHRHIFHVIVWVEQFRNCNHDAEYIRLKRWLQKDLYTLGWPTNASCEYMANEIAVAVKLQYAEGRAVRVEVTEDGENGALIELDNVLTKGSSTKGK